MSGVPFSRSCPHRNGATLAVRVAPKPRLRGRIAACHRASELLEHLLADPDAAAVMGGIRLIVLDISDRAIATQGRLKDSKLVRGPECA
jgi:hypothetical protein